MPTPKKAPRPKPAARVPEPQAAAATPVKPAPREAQAQAKKKAKPRVTNGGTAGNAREARDPMTVRQTAEAHDSSEREYVRGPYAPASTPICGAKGKQKGQPCKRPAGWGTDHPGVGKCKLHGGLSPAPTGRYSKIQRPRVKELLQQFESDPDPMNLLPEAQLLRALLTDYIERYDAQDEMLTRWNLSFEKSFQSDWAQWWRDMRADAIEREDDLSAELLAEMPDPMEYLPSKPLRMADITEVAGLITRVGAIIELIRKAQTQHTFTMDTVNLLWKIMAGHITDAAQEVISDDDIRSAYLTAVERRFATISLAELASRRAAD